jgi:hypothetical protein
MARPKGTPNTKTIAIVEPSRCLACHSTRRTRYRGRLVQPYDAHDSEGRPFTAIIRRRTQCLDCGQWRIDQTLWYSPAIPEPIEPDAEDQQDDGGEE